MFLVVALCCVQVGIGREKQPPNSQLIPSTTRVLLQEQAIVQHRGRRLSDASLPRYNTHAHTHTSVFLYLWGSSIIKMQTFNVFRECCYLLSCRELHEKINTTVMSVCWLWSYSQQTVNIALHKVWKQGETPNPALSNFAYQQLHSSLIIMFYLVSLIHVKNDNSFSYHADTSSCQAETQVYLFVAAHRSSFDAQQKLLFSSKWTC